MVHDYSKQKTPPAPNLQKPGPSPWATPERQPEPPQGTVIHTAPEGWQAAEQLTQVTTTAKDGSAVTYRGEVVGEARDGVVLIDVDSPVAAAARQAINDGRVTKLTKGALV